MPQAELQTNKKGPEPFDSEPVECNLEEIGELGLEFQDPTASGSES